MATVRFSGNLVSDIITIAKGVFDKRIEVATANLPVDWHGNIYDLLFKDTLAKMLALPDGFMGTQEMTKIQGFDPENHDDGLPGVSIMVKFGARRPWPTRFHYQSMGLTQPVHTYSGLMLNGTDPRWDGVKSSYLTYCRTVQSIRVEKDTFVAGVEKVIKTYSTLAPALKAWPPLWDLIPEEARIRHKTIVNRTKTEAVIEGVDLDSLTSTVALDRITR